ncbi:uncharacterized protein LOC110465176 isoform X2 [Mizuhopecten yessoensis]|uniref:uncharacterized protein LOC110465176 isoform X2 n=1 Tax=Mizuhopecten yessoensis TaxID=6573 RepID=UPI000B459AF9|nr:uncharacterized protein LOC110465176 isoform X2 [Mizuhopecten yessoensis]
MNWVGGARNRLRFSNERKIQKEFFERKKITKTGSRHTLTSSSRKHSEDLKAIHTVSNMHSDTFTFQQPRRPLKMLDLDKFRSKSSILPGNIDLGPSSPIKNPSKLQLLEASHHKQVARKVDRSPFDDDFFYPKSSQKYSMSSSNDDDDHTLQISQLLSSQKQFKIPDIPSRTRTPSSAVELTDDKRKVWNRKLTDEMFKHSSLPTKKHKSTFEPYNQSYRSIPHHDFSTDLLEKNIKQDQSKSFLKLGTHRPAQAIPFVSKSTPINPTGINMFITEDFQMTPIRKYHVEENPIPNLGLSHLNRNVELSDLSDVERPTNVERRSRIFQGEDFMQTPLTNETQLSEMFHTPMKTSFFKSTISQSVGDVVTHDKPALVKDQDEENEPTRYLTEARFETPLYKFTPKTQLQPVSIEENHDMLAARQNTHGESSERVSSFMTTLHGFRESSTERSKIRHTTESEMASFPETAKMQDSPKESASLSVFDHRAEKDEEVDKNTTHGNGNMMTEILDEMQELEEQDKMDEWMMADEYDSPHQEEPCIDQIEEEEILFQSVEEVKQAMNDILTRVVADCSDDFEFDHYDSLTDVQCSQQMAQNPEGTIEELHYQCSDKNISHQSDFNEMTTSELSANDGDVVATICDASTSTVDVETCDKGTQYSPTTYNVPLPLEELLSRSRWHRQFSVKPIQQGCEKGEEEKSNLESGTATSDEVETTYCLRSRKKV